MLLAILVLACGVSSEVLVLTDANFDKTIAESDKDFLIDIYAPWWVSFTSCTRAPCLLQTLKIVLMLCMDSCPFKLDVALAVRLRLCWQAHVFGIWQVL